MKKKIHPKDYRPVLFIDNSDGTEFIIPSTVATEETGKSKLDNLPAQAGKEYPIFRMEISSATHPFYTGEVKVLDTAGRVERFKQKQAKAKK
ncbi:MAG: 50S ribosomal protein L31 [Candidatus Zambryskibacteria bacterium CG_4_9_14_3_um_filter_42_9]|uniref:50S ribosomal protein L31 n=1 Tax=Candidatus Zambryskibacteria bacterium CG22_combo_CG10-13_8_21_14_all_42_17 TaxID=1975118 RepID=A0A2H0BDT7_9BACT|nr:MAG: 50S ribosomal protein L31 [Candidatus Zambryskibacteria bacterium CG22_combo_CG10-13_8_21_14_all_42_17]PJA37074.1 MAG: 50S ribosomal protein L31 [Candidatus Zambryskibacteria bacterium CG_4_9_14_3_um_filter_42_9]